MAIPAEGPLMTLETQLQCLSCGEYLYEMKLVTSFKEL